MIDWKQKLKNQWVQIEISRVQPGKPGNFLPLGPFPFQYSSALPTYLCDSSYCSDNSDSSQ